MTLPLSDTALIGTCMAAAAIGVLALTGGGDTQPAPADTAEIAAPATPEEDALAQLGAVPVSEAQDDTLAVDAEFGAKVRAYLLQNPEVIFEAVAEFERRNMAQQAGMDADLIAANYDEIFHDGHSWIGGNPDGDITLVEFSDYQCGFCKRAMPEVFSFLENDGNIRFIVKELPILGPESELASRFAMAVLSQAGDAAYEQIHIELMEHQGSITDDLLLELAEDHGLDGAALLDYGAGAEVTEILTRNRNLAQRLQVSGTPTFIMETELLRGYVPADTLAEIAAELRE